MKITIAEDFSRSPAGRFYSDGPHSAECFRDNLLTPKLKALPLNTPLTIELDGTRGYDSTFLKEAFGGTTLLFPEFGISMDIWNRISVTSRDRSLLLEVDEYIKDAMSNAR